MEGLTIPVAHPVVPWMAWPPPPLLDDLCWVVPLPPELGLTELPQLSPGQPLVLGRWQLLPKGKSCFPLPPPHCCAQPAPAWTGRSVDTNRALAPRSGPGVLQRWFLTPVTKSWLPSREGQDREQFPDYGRQVTV